MKNAPLQVDAYIARSAEFARPILERLRRLFHRACPEVEETIKWGVPHFDRRGILAGMAAFKKHVGFGFWRGREMRDPEGLFRGAPRASMCTVKITDVVELPSDEVLLRYIREAVELNEAGRAPKPRSNSARRPLKAPVYFLAALRKNKKALAAFEAFSPSCKREYVEWIVEAKQEATRERRIATAIAWMAQGKPRNWKYMRK